MVLAKSTSTGVSCRDNLVIRCCILLYMTHERRLRAESYSGCHSVKKLRGEPSCLLLLSALL